MLLRIFYSPIQLAVLSILKLFVLQSCYIYPICKYFAMILCRLCNCRFKPVLVHLVWKQITVLGFSNCVVCTLIIAVILCGNVCMYFEFIVYLASVNYLNISATNRRIFGRKISREASSAKRSIQKSPGVK